MKRLRGWRLPAIIALTAALVLVIHVAMAAVTVETGGAITNVKVVGQSTAATTTSTTFANVSTIKLNIPSGHTAFFVARFTAESACNGDTVGDGCALKFMVNSTELEPVTGSEFFFDSVKDDGSACPATVLSRQQAQPGVGTLATVRSCGWQGHAAQRTSPVFGAGTYYVRVQWAIVGAGSDLFWLDDWSFSVEEVQVS